MTNLRTTPVRRKPPRTVVRWTGTDHPGAVSGTSRRGSLVIEMIVCTILLATVSLTLVPTIHAVQQQRKAVEFESLMIVELNNQHQLLQESDKYSDVACLSGWFSNRYPEASLELQPVAAPAEPDSKAEEGLPSPAGFGSLLQAFEITIRHPGKEFQPEIVRSVMVWVPHMEVPAP